MAKQWLEIGCMQQNDTKPFLFLLLLIREQISICNAIAIADCCLSDHFTVLSNLTLSKPSFSVKEVSYRKLKGNDIKTFKEDLQQSDLCREERRKRELGDLVSCYDSVFSGLLDKRVPIIKTTITVRPRVPWFNDTIKASKRKRRKTNAYGEQLILSLIKQHLIELEIIQII